jgi:hypothetical protein
LFTGGLLYSTLQRRFKSVNDLYIYSQDKSTYFAAAIADR